MVKKSDPEIYRTRLFLISPTDYEVEAFASVLKEVFDAGDVASFLLLPPINGSYNEAAERLIPIAQEYDVASLLHNDSQIMGRSGADGLHLDGALDDIVETVKAHTDRNIMGIGNIKARHEAMVIAEGPVDYLFFGRLDGDTKSNIFPKMFKLAEWWSGLFSVPAVVMGGNTLESVEEAGEAGIDFIALRDAIWQAPDPAAAVRKANDMLDQSFETRKALANA